MNSLPRIILVIGALLLALTFAKAQPATANTKLSRLEIAIPLTTEQTKKIAEIFQNEQAQLEKVKAATPVAQPNSIVQMIEIRRATRRQVRAQLTPEQQKKYDHTPQAQGGGQMINVDNRVAQLDSDLVLSPEQKVLAAQIYENENEELQAFAPTERTTKGQETRQASKALIHGMLSDHQRAKQDELQRAAQQRGSEERQLMESALRTSKALATRVGTITELKGSKVSTSHFDANGKISGKSFYNVTGTTHSETITVCWEKVSLKSPLSIVRLESADGQPIEL